MDIISGLNDDLLVKILLLLPTKVAVSTSILSKRWEFIWMWLPKLEYTYESNSESEYKSLKLFLDRNMPLHRAPVIERLRLRFYTEHLKPEDIKLWVTPVVSRIIRELQVSYDYYYCQLEEPIMLPSNLYTCKSLVTLKLKEKILIDVPRMVYLPSLKTLQLKHVTYFNQDCLPRLLSNCPVLEDLLVQNYSGGQTMNFSTVSVKSLKRLSLDIVDRNMLPSNLYTCELLVTLKLGGTMILLDVPRTVCLPSLKTLHLDTVTFVNEDCLQRLLSNCPVLEDLLVEIYGGKMKKFTVIVPSLQRLSLDIDCDDVDEFVINTPSLKYFELHYLNSKTWLFSIENMPTLREAHVHIKLHNLKSLIRSITSVKRLDICITGDSLETVYGDGFVFNTLEHLKLCLCSPYVSNVLVWLLKISPNLLGLDLHRMDDHGTADSDGSDGWIQQSTIPRSMLSNLQNFGWSEYLGEPHDGWASRGLYFRKHSSLKACNTLVS